MALALIGAVALSCAIAACGGGGGGKSQAHRRPARGSSGAAAQAQRRANQRAHAGGCPRGLVPEGTAACVKPGGAPAGCGGNPYSTPTRHGGCIGPAHPPSTGPATHCPPGQVPAGTTGACAPPQAPGGGAPSVDSPEGQRMLHTDPDCRGEPPPPPSYHGPVQC